MTGGSEGSNTPDFAFEPPAMPESGSAIPAFDPATKNNAYPVMSGGYAPNGGFTQPFAPFFAGPGSSFSSSSTGASFSSVDALPAISRDFHRPATSETRRPATAGGALQSLGLFDERKHRDDLKSETIDESAESMFSNPFEPTNRDAGKMVASDVMDPHFNAARRSTEPTHHLDSIGWQEHSTPPDQSQSASPHTPFSMGSAPAHMNQFGFTNPQNQQHLQMNRAPSGGYTTRPQTSDGLPSYSGVNPNGVSLPSARTLVNQIDPNPSFPSPHSAYPGQPYAPVRDARAASLGDINAQSSSGFPGVRHYSMSSAASGSDSKSNELTFVPLGGPAPKKRPRRRYDEIERLYTCGWNGCEKAYGTLNHLNAHVAMQKHGEKRLPSEFKDMRKAWRKKKREQAAAAANAQYMASSTTWNPRNSISSESEYDRRESNASFVSTSDYSSHRGSIVYSGYQWDPSVSRPTTSSSVASSADGRFPASAYASGMINPSPASRRQSAPTHMPIPANATGFRVDGQPTPTPSHPFGRPPPAQSSYPFQSLTSPMPMMGQAGQFAFQR